MVPPVQLGSLVYTTEVPP